ncbi:NAD(P)-dependent oxidoreductase [Bacillus sp. MM2020_1]|nr:NAD(P)-dependent oxidoreductase [Bacillus sp. MM2020_1]
MKNKTKIGIVGTGFIAKGLVYALDNQDDLYVSKILTRRVKSEVNDTFPHNKLTNSINELIENSDIVVECSGDVIHGTDVIDKVMTSSIPVVTMNAELQVTTGSYFAKKGFITEAEGDQPGCLAAFRENVIQMGFEPIVFGNIKGFLNLNPSIEDMMYWSNKKGISLQMVTSFTDGTKVQIEQTLVANGLNSTIAQKGLTGMTVSNVEVGGQELARLAEEMNTSISDYILCPGGPPGVFITAKHKKNQQQALSYLKMGDGPFYTMTAPFHLCHLEIVKTIRRVINGGNILLNNSSSPTVSVAAIAKRDLSPGEAIDKGIGSFKVRGEAVRIIQEPSHIPIGLLSNAVITKYIKAGEIITFSDVDIHETLATKIWLDIAREQSGKLLGI